MLLLQVYGIWQFPFNVFNNCLNKSIFWPGHEHENVTDIRIIVTFENADDISLGQVGEG